MGAAVSASAAPASRDVCGDDVDPQPGDILRFRRGLYSHWAVCLGTGEALDALPALPECLRGELNPTTRYVGHLTRHGADFGGGVHLLVTKAVPFSDLRDMLHPSLEALDALGAPNRGALDALEASEPAVTLQPLDAVARESPVEVANEQYDAYFARTQGLAPFPPKEIVVRALRCLGLTGYSLLGRNCEHFASWLRYGVAKSLQADDAVTGAARGVAATVGATAGGAAAIATGGSFVAAAALALGSAAAVTMAMAPGSEAMRMNRDPASKQPGQPTQQKVPFWGRCNTRGTLYEHEWLQGCSRVGKGEDTIGKEWEARQVVVACRENRL